MDLKTLKESLESKSYKPSTIVFECDDKFIPLQYIKYIQDNNICEVNYLESLDDIPDNNTNIFCSENSEDNILNVLICDSLDTVDYNIVNNNVWLVVKNIDKEVTYFYNKYLIKVSDLSEWQVKDYLYSLLEGIETKYLDWMLHICNNDINRVDCEISKLSIFKKEERNSMFLNMVEDGAFDDLSPNTIFDFTNAIMRKEVEKIGKIYLEIDNIDINDFGLLTVLHNNFLNTVNIQLGINVSPTSLNMKTGQFNAIRRNCGKYSNKALVDILHFLTSIDSRVKKGELPPNIMRDYMILTILNDGK